MMSIKSAIVGLAIAIFPAGAMCADESSVDFDFYKTRVEPIFARQRATHGRCMTCHSGRGNGLALQPLAPGKTSWTEEQSRQNYEIVSNLVSPGQPTSSPLLMHPLAPEAGGDLYHSGGHQFASQNDPEWLVLAEWVRQKPKAQYKNLKVLKSTEHLMDTMRFFNVALREDCTFCHVSGDFASDRNPRKTIARNMIQMTANLGQTLGKGQVNCYTCHRGDATPQTVHVRFPNLQPE